MPRVDDAPGALSCPACSGPLRAASWSVISPWVRRRIGCRERLSTFHTCVECSSGAFSYRYSEQEMDLLYADYRGQAYFAQRHTWEPTYTSALNEDFGSDPIVVRARQDVLEDAIHRSAGPHSAPVRVAVDIGGDRGQFIPPSIPGRYVLEVSGRTPLMGVTAVGSFGEARELQPDLVMVCGLLEHLSDPASFLAAIREDLQSSAELMLYIEVPAGVPDPSTRSVPPGAKAFAHVACRLRPVWNWLDRRSARSRTQHGREFALMPLRQSEHLNFFTLAGLSRLVEASDGSILLIDEYPMPTQLTQGGRVGFSQVLRALALLPGKPRGESPDAPVR